jgi:hypothetical protein
MSCPERIPSHNRRFPTLGRNPGSKFESQKASIEWHFVGNGAGVSNGAYIDDVVVTALAELLSQAIQSMRPHSSEGGRPAFRGRGPVAGQIGTVGWSGQTGASYP